MLWFKIESAVESSSLLEFNSGETEVYLLSATSSIVWRRADPLEMSLDLTIAPDTWIRSGGQYRQDGVIFFTNSDHASLDSVTPTTGLNLEICKGMSLSAPLQLHLLGVWNQKIPLTSLKKSSLNYILERESAVLFLQFNFLYSRSYPNWLDPSNSVPGTFG